MRSTGSGFSINYKVSDAPVTENVDKLRIIYCKVFQPEAKCKQIETEIFSGANVYSFNDTSVGLHQFVLYHVKPNNVTSIQSEARNASKGKWL